MRKKFDDYKKMDNVNNKNKNKLVKKDQIRCVCVKICFLALSIIHAHNLVPAFFFASLDS